MGVEPSCSRPIYRRGLCEGFDLRNKHSHRRRRPLYRHSSIVEYPRRRRIRWSRWARRSRCRWPWRTGWSRWCRQPRWTRCGWRGRCRRSESTGACIRSGGTRGERAWPCRTQCGRCSRSAGRHSSRGRTGRRSRRRPSRSGWRSWWWTWRCWWRRRWRRRQGWWRSTCGTGSSGRRRPAKSMEGASGPSRTGNG